MNSKINILNNIFLSVIFILNFASMILNKSCGSVSIITQVTIFLLLLVSIYSTILKTHYGAAILYLVCGIVTSFIGNQGNATGIVFIIFSIHLFNRTCNSIYVISIITMLTILIKAVINNYDLLQVLKIMAFYLAIFMIYNTLFAKRER